MPTGAAKSSSAPTGLSSGTRTEVLWSNRRLGNHDLSSDPEVRREYRPQGVGVPGTPRDRARDGCAQARWPAGPLLVDLDETVLRTLLAPQLAAALHVLNAAPGHHIGGQ